jgi:haloalkane dehalogenase
LADHAPDSTGGEELMEVIRTPDERFINLAGYPFGPHYAEVAGLRIHYVDEGPRTALPVLLLHGEPSWSYLYRKMIPILAAAGHRVVAPDLVGFGRSDKPVRREDYTYQRHVDWVRGLVEGLDLRDITLVGQDWGGLIGLRLAAENEDRFARIVAANTFLPTGDMPPGDAFLAWRRYSQETPDFHVGGIVRGGCVTDLAPEVIAAYNAPFPDDRYKAGARQFPALVPISPDDPAAAPNRKAWEVLSRWRKPFLTAFSDSDPITRGADRILQQAIPGAEGQSHTTIVGAGHFLQEDKGEELARVIVDFITRTVTR